MNNMNALTITKENFENEVTNSEKPVLLDFWAAWCGPCKMVSPVIDEIAGEVSHAKVGKINVDEQPELAAKFRVMSIPTLAVMKGGKIINTMVGARNKDAILSMLNV
jgi:thioredoxin 1